jgi:hypothetical protein
METYFPYEQFANIQPEWKQYYRSIYIYQVDEDGIYYFTQEGTRIKIKLQPGQEYPLDRLKQICYHKSRSKQGQPTFKFELRR